MVLAGGGSAGAVIGLARALETVSTAALVAVCLGIPLCAWLLFTERHGAALIVVAGYLGLVDGFIRLRTGDEGLTVIRDILFYLVLLGAVVRLAVKDGRLEVPPWTAWIAAFVALALVQLLNPANPSFQTSLLGLRPHLEWVPLFFFGYALLRTPHRLRVFLVVLLCLAAANGVVGFVQLNLSVDQLAAWGPGYADLIEGANSFRNAGRVYYDAAGAHVRPPALGPDTAFGGRIGFLAVPGALAMLVAARRPGLRLGVLCLSAGAALAIISSQGRTNVVAAVVAMFAFAILATMGGRGLRVVMALAIAAVVGYGAAHTIASSSANDPFTRYSTVTPGRLIASTTQDRGTSLSAIPSYFTESPFGVGLARSGPASGLLGASSADLASVANSETEFNYLLSELGVPGLFVLLGFSLLVIGASFGAVRRMRDPETRLLLSAVAAPLIAILVIWVATSTSATIPLSPYMWFASGAMAYWWRQTRTTANSSFATA